MEATMQTLNVTIPTSDVKFFKEIMKKMGWIVEKSRKRKIANTVTLDAIEEARTKEAIGTIDTSSYDAFVNSILS